MAKTGRRGLRIVCRVEAGFRLSPDWLPSGVVSWTLALFLMPLALAQHGLLRALPSWHWPPAPPQRKYGSLPTRIIRSRTDPTLGVSDCAWWPGDDQSPALGEFERYGEETLTVDAERRVVVVVREVVPWSAGEIAEREAARRREMALLIDAERDRRISAGLEFAGVRYQSRLPSPDRAGDWEVFSGKALEALIAIMGGAQPGDLRWSDPAEDFAWIAADNSRVPMDAQTVIELAKAASAHRSRHTFAGSDLKELNPIPADYAADHNWP